MPGPLPKPPGTAARRNAQITTTVPFTPGPQPSLPDHPKGVEWPERTIKFWDDIAGDPISSMLTPLDWHMLFGIALIHADVWSGNLRRVSELQKLLADFGVTPAARARLRIILADAADRDDQRSEKVAARGAGASEPAARYKGLKAVQ